MPRKICWFCHCWPQGVRRHGRLARLPGRPGEGIFVFADIMGCRSRCRYVWVASALASEHRAQHPRRANAFAYIYTSILYVSGSRLFSWGDVPRCTKPCCRGCRSRSLVIRKRALLGSFSRGRVSELVVACSCHLTKDAYFLTLPYSHWCSLVLEPPGENPRVPGSREQYCGRTSSREHPKGEI